LGSAVVAGARAVEADLTPDPGAEQISAEADMRQREAWLSAVVEQTHDLVAIYDHSGCFVFASPSHERVLGWRPNELLGVRSVELLHPDESAEVIRAFTEQYLDPKKQGPLEHRIRCKDGSWRWVEAVVVDIKADPAIGALVTARDVTERREANLLSVEQAAVLEKIARGAPLEATLATVVDMLERRIPDAVGGSGSSPSMAGSRSSAPRISLAAAAPRLIATPFAPSPRTSTMTSSSSTLRTSCKKAAPKYFLPLATRPCGRVECAIPKAAGTSEASRCFSRSIGSQPTRSTRCSSWRRALPASPSNATAPRRV